METHVLMKTYDRIESEIENINIDTDQKREIIDLLRDRMKSEINLNIAKAFEASAKAELSKEQIKTVDAQIGLWADQADFWGATIENQRKQILKGKLQADKIFNINDKTLYKVISDFRKKYNIDKKLTIHSIKSTSVTETWAVEKSLPSPLATSAVTIYSLE